MLPRYTRMFRCFNHNTCELLYLLSNLLNLTLHTVSLLCVNFSAILVFIFSVLIIHFICSALFCSFVVFFLSLVHSPKESDPRHRYQLLQKIGEGNSIFDFSFFLTLCVCIYSYILIHIFILLCPRTASYPT